MREYNDKSMIDWIKGDDLKKRDEVFVILYKEFYPIIQKFVLQNKGTDNDARDIFQDGLIVLYNQVLKDAFQGNSTIKTYLYSICRNLWLKKITRTKGTFELIDNQVHIETKPSALQSLIGTEREQCVETLLQQLGTECNSILKYFYYDKLSMVKIRDVMQLASEQVAKNKKMKCLKKLRRMVSENLNYLSLLKK